MLSGGVQLVFNTTEGAQAIADSFSLRRTALTNGIPYYTTVAGARAAVQAIARAARPAALKSPRCNPTLDRSARWPCRRSCILDSQDTKLFAMNKIPMTADGYNRLQEELKRLKTDRPAGRSSAPSPRRATHGDLSENAEYHAARERQSFIEGRVIELEDKIARAEVIDVSKLSGTVIKFGATVTLADEETDEETDLSDRRRGRGRHQQAAACR